MMKKYFFFENAVSEKIDIKVSIAIDSETRNSKNYFAN